MKNLLITLSFFSIMSGISAQVDRETQPEGDAPSLTVSKDRIYGKVLDTKTNKGIEAASVQLIAVTLGDNKNERKEKLVGAMLTKSNGDFSFEYHPEGDSLILIVTVTGYKPLTQRLALEKSSRQGDENRRREGDWGRGKTEMDLGNLMMEEDVQQLGMVTVVSEKPALQMGIDRKIFNVEKSLVSTGGTGLDVMKNIPSVSVDVDGNVTLRNASPQIFVDGRPTILTIDQIPAEHIERVELITNPSAKFDASTGAGIINIVLKKNKRIGLNGIISAGIGTPDQNNANLNFSMREGKINFFAGAGHNHSGGAATSRTLRQNKKGGVIDNYFNQHSINDRLRDFNSVRFGFDYFIDNRNTLSINQSIFRGERGNDEIQNQEYLNSNKEMEYLGYRSSDTRMHFNRNRTRLTYTHKFPKEDKELTGNINYNYGKGSELTNILNTFTYPDGSPYTADAIVRNDGHNNSDQWTFELDFVNPINENRKLEAGLRSYINDYTSQYNAFAISNGSETKLPLSNNYKYTEVVNAAYITWGEKIKSYQFQAGLRAEHSKFDGTLIDSVRKFGYEYPNKLNRIWDALFPSLFVTKTITEDIELQVNYSRRIRRPNFWQLNPFIDINDPVNLRQGNPELKPEFVNSFEFNYSHSYGKGNNFLGVIYYRNNPGDITRYSDTITTEQYQQLNNAAVDPNAILNTFINAQSTNRLGAEFTLQQKFGNNFEVTPTIDLQYRKVKAKFSGLDLNNDGFSWESKLILNYKFGQMVRSMLLQNLSFQMIGEYESSRVMAQGKRTPEYSVDFALRKDFLKDRKLNFTFSINDIFNTQRWGSIYDTEYFYQDSYWRRHVRSFRIVLSYKFGDAEFSLRRNRGGGNNDDE